MDIKKAIEDLKPMLGKYLEEKGREGKTFRCLNPLHTDKHPSMAYYESDHRVYCFGCGARYNIIDLLAMDLGYGEHPKGKDFIDVLKYGCTKYGIPYTDILPMMSYVDKCHEDIWKTDYFQKRGLGDKVIKRFKLGYDDDFKLSATESMKAAIIPTGHGYVARNTDPASEIRFRSSKGTRRGIYNKEAFDEASPIIATEGEIDALSLIECGFRAFALGGTGNIREVAPLCKKHKFSSTILIALDNDEPGKAAAEKLEEDLRQNHVRCKTISPYGSCKDANEALLADKLKLELAIGKEIRSASEKEAREQENTGIIAMLDKLDEKQKKNIKKRIKWYLEENERKIQDDLVGIPEEQRRAVQPEIRDNEQQGARKNS